MYELVQAAKDTYFIQSPTRIGLYRLNEKDVCLIDSGNDKEAGRKLRKLLNENGWNLAAIYNTHSHADHIGGNKYLQGQTGCRIYAPGIDCAFTNHPVLEPSFLYGGYPCKDLRHKFLLAQESSAELLTPEVLPDGFELLSLPGHSFAMAGFRTPDDIVFLADCLSSKETLDKYKVGVLFDVGSYLETLEKVKSLSAKLFIPAHAAPTEDIAPLAQYNIDQVLEIAEQIVALCKEPLSFEEILQRLFETYGLKMDFEQYALVGSTIRSYLSWLKDNGRLNVCFEHSRLLWQQAEG